MDDGMGVGTTFRESRDGMGSSWDYESREMDI